MWPFEVVDDSEVDEELENGPSSTSRMMAGHFTSGGGTLGGVGRRMNDSDDNRVWLLWMWWRELMDEEAN